MDAGQKATQKTCVRCNYPKPFQSFALVDGKYRRNTCRRCRRGESPRPHTPGDGKPAAERPAPLKFLRPIQGKRFLITAAQNATPVDQEFLATLKVAAEHMAAELIIIPLRYKNPTSVWTRRQASDEWWAEETVPYLFNGRKKLARHLVLAGDVKVIPTAQSPLTGFESLTGPESCILGHPRMQFLTVSVPSGFPKILTTTGVCTKRNYTDSKAGKIGEFHHFLGGLVVELEGPYFHIRQINASRTDGSFIDLATRYTKGGVEKAPPALTLTMGDTHVRVHDPEVDRATFGPGGMVEVLNPETLVWEDVGDGETTNPHDDGDPFIAEAKRKANRLDVEAEVREVADFIRARSKGRRSVVVDSNHNDFLARWAKRTDMRFAGRNMVFGLETQLIMARSAKMEPGGAGYVEPFVYWLQRFGVGENVRCLGPNESYEVEGVEHGMHGHRGPNGSKGTVKNLSRLGTKVTSGHGHAPAIEGGHYRVGTGAVLRQAYEKGPSNHMQTHCVQYANGKRALISIIRGHWRAKPIRS